MAKISLRNVTWAGEREQATATPLSFEVADREFVSILGPCNLEIARLVRSIAGLEQVSTGEIFVGDQSVNNIPPSQRDIALVSQGYVPYPRMSVRENLTFALALRKRPKAEIEKRVLAAAELAGVQSILDDKGMGLSNEQRQRLAVAHAVVINPKAILFDRALGGLDDRARRQMRNEVAKLYQRLQVTTIVGTCDPIEAISLGGRVIVIRSGVIEQEGAGLSLVDEPANMFVADFVGGMNMVHGTLKQERDSWVFSERDPGTIKLRLPSSELSAMREIVPGPTLLGIRSEEIEVAQPSDSGGRGDDGFPAIVDRVESVAGGLELFLRTGSHTVTSRIQRSATSPGAGHRSRFRATLSRVRLFDPSTGRRVV